MVKKEISGSDDSKKNPAVAIEIPKISTAKIFSRRKKTPKKKAKKICETPKNPAVSDWIFDSATYHKNAPTAEIAPHQKSKNLFSRAQIFKFFREFLERKKIGALKKNVNKFAQKAEFSGVKLGNFVNKNSKIKYIAAEKKIDPKIKKYFFCIKWQRQGESNPCCQDENLVS